MVVMDNSLASRRERGGENEWLSESHILAGQHREAGTSAPDERLRSGSRLEPITAVVLCLQAHYVQCGSLGAQWTQ